MPRSPYVGNRTEETLKAQGNLSYIQFIRLLQHMWYSVHPDIPLVATGTNVNATYPVIIYRLDLRKPMQVEPKPRFREEIPTEPNEDAQFVAAQRFQNVVTFTVITESNPELAEIIIEEFEDFMMIYIPVFKELGLSEIVYARRLPDVADQRTGQGVVERSVSFLVTTEKISRISMAKINKVRIDARVWIKEAHQATPNLEPATPNIEVVIPFEGQYEEVVT